MNRFLVGRLLGRFWSFLLGLIAYGPWGYRIHQVLIRFYRWVYKIDWPQIKDFRKLGDFFLREKEWPVADSPLVSPVEAAVLEGPLPVSARVSVKGISYRWNELPEWDPVFEKGTYWNLYLSPPDYHWIHFPCDAQNVRAIRIPGLDFPVNTWGRRLAPDLYFQNERLSFRFTHPQLGEVLMMLVGAMGVSKIISSLGPVGTAWTPLPSAKQMQKTGGFAMGSSVLLLVEKIPQGAPGLERLTPGCDLLRK